MASLWLWLRTPRSAEEVFATPQKVRFAQLRLPQVGHLFEILKKRDQMDIGQIPLTIGEARREIKSLLLNR